MRTKVVNKQHEPYDIFIGRGSIFGNPFEIGIDGDREQVIKRYQHWFNMLTRDEAFVDQVLRLEGKTLGCFCVPQPCHGEVIVEWLKWYRKEGAVKRAIAIEAAENGAAEDCFTSGNCGEPIQECNCHAGEAEMEDAERATTMEHEQQMAQGTVVQQEVKPKPSPAYDPTDVL
jgi:hypothetical protein